MADPNRLRGPTRANDHGKLYEAKVAPKLSARLRPASGAMVGAKGDMVNKDWLFESKTTTGKTLAVELGWLVKITAEAIAARKNPALVMSFVLPSGRPVPNCESEWVAMPLQTYKELTGGS